MGVKDKRVNCVPWIKLSVFCRTESCVLTNDEIDTETKKVVKENFIFRVFCFFNRLFGACTPTWLFFCIGYAKLRGAVGTNADFDVVTHYRFFLCKMRQELDSLCDCAMTKTISDGKVSEKLVSDGIDFTGF